MNAIDHKFLGDLASNRYFEGEGKSLQEIISQIAREEELNPHEISRVCQRANTKVMLRLFREGSDKTVEFDVADPRVIVDTLFGQEVRPAETPIEAPCSHKGETAGDEFYEPMIDYQEIERLIFMLEDKIQQLKTRLYEERPSLVQQLASRIHHHGPKVVAIAFKKVAGPDFLLREAFEKAGVDPVDETLDLDAYLVDDRDELLQKVASYGNMISDAERLSEHLEKLSFVRSAIRAAVRDPLKVMTVGGEVSNVGEKTKKHKDIILGKIKNPPRVGAPSSGYVKPNI